MSKKQAFPVLDDLRGLAETLAQSLKTYGLDLPHRSALQVIAHLADQPNYQTLVGLCKGGKLPARTSPSRGQVHLAVRDANARVLNEPAVVIEMPLAATTAILDRALDVAIADAQAFDASRPVRALREIVMSSPLKAAFQAPTSTDLNTTFGRRAFLEGLGLEILDNTPDGYAWELGDESSQDMSFSCEADAVEDAWSTLLDLASFDEAVGPAHEPHSTQALRGATKQRQSEAIRAYLSH